MGKKQKKGKTTESGKGTEFPAKVKRETLEIVKQLLEKCTVQGGGSKDWDRYTEIFGLVSKLRDLQAGYTLKLEERSGHLSEFVEWLNGQGVAPEAVAVGECPQGMGLNAQTQIQEADLIMKIPRKLIMSTQTAKESVLGSLIAGDRILQSMPNVVLALHLLCESHNKKSTWRPYLNILPSTYSTPLYFTLEEVKLLKGSPALDEVINQYRSIARQYAYFYKLFDSLEGNKPPLMPFCYDDYRWAVSTVMTRQNQVPSVSGEQMLTGFIPLYDMANHANGEMSTDFSLEEDCIKCFAMRNFSQGEQVFIFYGQRSNAEFLLHNGFIYPQNEFDKINVKLGISKNDPLYSMKAELLARVSLLPSRLFSFYKGEDPVDSETLAYLRVFNMDQGELASFLTGDMSKQTSRLRDFSEVVSLPNERKVWKFLETRLQLLLRSYPTSLQEESSLLQGSSLSPHARLCVQLTHQEKKLLHSAAAYAREYLTGLEMEVQRHAMGGGATVSDGQLEAGQGGRALTNGQVEAGQERVVMSNEQLEAGQGGGATLTNGQLEEGPEGGALANRLLDAKKGGGEIENGQVRAEKEGGANANDRININGEEGGIKSLKDGAQDQEGVAKVHEIGGTKRKEVKQD